MAAHRQSFVGVKISGGEAGDSALPVRALAVLAGPVGGDGEGPEKSATKRHGGRGGVQGEGGAATAGGLSAHSLSALPDSHGCGTSSGGGGVIGD